MTAPKTSPYTGKLTPAHLGQIHTTRAEWMTTGLATHQPDRATAEHAIRNLYQANGLPEPPLMIWMDSPLGCLYAMAVLVKASDGQLGDQLGDQLWGQLGDQFGDQLWGELRGQLRGELWGELGGELRGQLRGELWGELWGELRGQLRGELRDQLRDQLWGQLRGELWGELWDQLRDQLRGQLGDQLWGQLWGQLRGELWGELWDQLWGQLRGQLGDQLWGQLWDQLRGELRGELWDQLRGEVWSWISNSFYSWNDAYWLAIYNLALPIAGLPMDPKLAALSEAVTEVGWFIPTRLAVVMCGRPTRLGRDPGNALHSADGPALAYADGWGFCAWHGRRVPAWVVEEPTVERISSEENVEIRRCAIESLGWDRFTEQAGLVPAGCRAGTKRRSTELADARVPDPGNPGQHLVLYDVPEELWGSRIRLLMCTNGSAERDGTRRRYGLTTPAHISDPIEAAAWTYGLTRDQYAGMQRRT